MHIKSHFEFTKEQRNGIFFLLLLILLFQCVYFFVASEDHNILEGDILVDNEAFNTFKREIDSLRLAQIEKRKPKQFPFNPNFITDYKGASLGMSNEEIDRLFVFRQLEQWVYSASQFQEVTKISDSLLEAISPYFKFPNWVSKTKTKKNRIYDINNNTKTFAQKKDLNIVTVKQLQTINGIGKVLSERIIRFRNKFEGGFIHDVQLNDVYGLTNELITKITSQFTVKTPGVIKKFNINIATSDELVTIQHIDYDLAHNIIEERKLREGYKSLDELSKVKGFPVNKIDIIKLYLTLD